MFPRTPDIETQQRADLMHRNFTASQTRERRILAELREKGINKIYADAGLSGQPHLGQFTGSFSDLVIVHGPVDIYTRKPTETYLNASVAVASFPYPPLSETDIEAELVQGRDKLTAIDQRLTQFSEAQRRLFSDSPPHQPFHKLITLTDEPVLLTEHMPPTTWHLQWKKGEIGPFEIPDIARQHLEVVKIAHELGFTFRQDFSINPLYTHFLNSYLLAENKRYVTIPNPDHLVTSSRPTDLLEDRTAILRLILDIDQDIRTKDGKQQLFNRDRRKIDSIVSGVTSSSTDEGLLEIFRNFEFMREADIRRLLSA